MYWATPNEPRTYIAPDANGTATGTSGADDIYATGPGQTLIGNGGDDIFHIGTNTDAPIVENDQGLSTVDTWASSYTLPEGVDNLTAEGDYSHTLIGNAAANAITGAGGNDLIYGGKNDWLVGGGGQDTFVVRNGDAAEGIFDMKPGAGGDVVRLVDTGWTSFDEVKAHMTDLPGGDSTPGAPPIQHSSQVVLPSGERLNFDHVSMDQLTADNFTFDNSGVTPSPSPSPTPTPNGSGVHVRVSGDYFDGPAQFTAVVGDKSYGPFTVTASHAAGEWQDILMTPDVPASSFGVTISFINDAYGGDSAHDRNMYVDYISVNGKTYEGENAMGNTANGGSNSADPNAGDMFSNGDLTFYVFQGNGGGGSPSPTPSADEPTPTPTESRNYVAPNSSGVAQGTSGADDIFASADEQTLIGDGGNDIFHVGTYNGLSIQETGSGTSAVSTWGDFALGDGIDNLIAEGGYGHRLTGNAGANVIAGNTGNDTLDGGAGNDLLIGGGGSDTYRFGHGGGQDEIVNATGTGAAAGTLDFGNAIARNQLWLSESGNDLQILLMGSTDRIMVKDWYASPAAQLQGLQTTDGSHLDARLQNLVDAMASFTANHPGFDPTTVSQAPDDPNLQNAIAASWH
jgi:Ca2+-binding RTX toxin-like protein